MTEQKSTATTFAVAHLTSTRSTLSGLVTVHELLARLNDETEDAAEWWAHIEQSDGYLVGHRVAGGRWTFGGTTVLDTSKLMDGRVFSPTTELRFGWGSGTLTFWRNTHTPESALPQWVAPHVTPLEVDALLIESGASPWQRDDDSGFTRVTQGNGQTIIVPVSFEGFSDRTRLRIRRHFAWDPRTGRVWIEAECLAGYINGSN